MEHFQTAETLVTLSDENQCRHIKDDGRRCGQTVSQETDYCLWHDPSRAEEAEAARELGGIKGGRKRRYVKGTKVDISALSDVLEGLGEVIGNLRMMDQTVSTCNSLIRAWQVAAGCFLDQQEREELMAEIDDLKESLGLE